MSLTPSILTPETAIDLDDSQRAAIAAASNGSVSVIGAPGTGKTHALIELVAQRILVDGVPDSRVLVMAPSRRAAASLRDRLAKRLNVSTVGTLGRTPQSFAFEIVRDRRARERLAGLSEKQDPKLFTGADQDRTIAELLHGELLDAEAVERGTAGASARARLIAWPEHLGPEVRQLRGFRNELRELLATMSEFEVSPDELEALAQNNPVWLGASQFARSYINATVRERFSDVDAPGLLNEAARAIVAGAADLAAGHSGGLYGDASLVVVDDAQELTESARKLLAAFERAGATVVTFGDPDVSTGGFRGARPEHAVSWRERGEEQPSRAILSTVHRAHPAIREATARLTGSIGARFEARHRAARVEKPAESATPDAPTTPEETRRTWQPPAPVTRYFAPTATAEAEAIGNYLRELHLFGGVAWSDMAVLVRSSGSIPATARLLDRVEVPTLELSPPPADEDPAVRAIIAVADLATDRAEFSGPGIEQLLRSPLFGVDALDMRRLRRALRFEELAGGGDRPSNDLLVEAITYAGGLVTVDPDGESLPAGAHVIERFRASRHFGRNRAVRAAQTLAACIRDAASAHSEGGSIEDVLFAIWDRSGVAQAWEADALGEGIASHEANARLNAVCALFDVAKRFVERDPNAPAGTFLEEWSRRDVTNDSLAPRDFREGVTLTTPAGAVGQEFRVVVVAGVNEGVWPNLRLRDTLLGAGRLAELKCGEDLEREVVDRRRDVLHDETRLFAQAVSRASDWLLVTAVSDEDTQPSVFATMIGGDDMNPATIERGLSLRQLAARIRREASTAAVRDRAEHASALAQLADAGVSGADPSDWFGIRESSSTRFIGDPPAGSEGPRTLRLRPSGVTRFEECGVDWFVNQYSGTPSSAAMTIGSIVHESAEYAFETLEARLEHALTQHRGIPFEAEWMREKSERRLRELVSNLSAYLHRATLRATTIGVERSFALELDLREHDIPATLHVRGKIDRLERERDGGLVVVDFKTGKPESHEDAASNPQLGLYQLACSLSVIAQPDWATAGAHEHEAPSLPASRYDDGSPIDQQDTFAEARLIYIAHPNARDKNEWSTRTQGRFSEEELTEFTLRIEAAALGMIGVTPAVDDVEPKLDHYAEELRQPPNARFTSRPESHCFAAFGGNRSCRIHAIGEVSE